jgi:large-conductance mechanosensitive channel
VPYASIPIIIQYGVGVVVFIGAYFGSIIGKLVSEIVFDSVSELSRSGTFKLCGC